MVRRNLITTNPLLTWNQQRQVPGYNASLGSVTGCFGFRGTRNISVSPGEVILSTPLRFLIESCKPDPVPYPGVPEPGGQVDGELEAKYEQCNQAQVVSSSGHRFDHPGPPAMLQAGQGKDAEGAPSKHRFA